MNTTFFFWAKEYVIFSVMCHVVCSTVCNECHVVSVCDTNGVQRPRQIGALSIQLRRVRDFGDVRTYRMQHMIRFCIGQMLLQPIGIKWSLPTRGEVLASVMFGAYCKWCLPPPLHFFLPQTPGICILLRSVILTTSNSTQIRRQIKTTYLQNA